MKRSSKREHSLRGFEAPRSGNMEAGMSEGKKRNKDRNQEEKAGKGFEIISIAVFMAILALPAILWLGVCLAGQGVVQQLDYDLGENRNRAPFPDSFRETFPAEFESYYNDRLPFRSLIISADRKLTALFEKPYDALVGPCLVKLMGLYQEDAFEAAKEDAETGMEAQGKQGTKAEETEYLLPKVHNDAVVEGRLQWLFYVRDNSLEDYLGSNVLSEEEMNSYLDGMEKLQKICTEQGKELFFLIPPNKEQVYPELMPSYQVADSYKKAQRLADYVKAHSDIQIAYPLQELKAAKEQWQLYFKRDTHWNTAGAFIGVKALYEMMGIQATELTELSMLEEAADFDEDLVRMGNLNQEDFEEDIQYNIYYKLYVETAVEFGDGADSDVYITRSTAENQHSLALIGDSFRTFMTQYLTRDFGSCAMIHWLHMDEAEAVKAVKNADILVIELVERNNQNLPDIMELVCGILEM